MFEIIDNTELVNVTLPENATAELIESTNVIIDAIKEMGNQSFIIGSELVKVRDSKSFLPSFASITDYGEQVFGFKKSAVYNFMKIADLFLDDKGNIKNKMLSTMSPKQLEALTPLRDEQIDELIYNSSITPDMTVSQLKKTVKDYKDAKKTKSQVKKSTQADNVTSEVKGTDPISTEEAKEKIGEVKNGSDNHDECINEFGTLENLSAIIFMDENISITFKGLPTGISTRNMTFEEWVFFRESLFIKLSEFEHKRFDYPTEEQSDLERYNAENTKASIEAHKKIRKAKGL